ncbi:MAG: DNA/RNA nuclease SfsA [Thermoplasmata archaeon]|nr:DNA/RNA nuclease SfsA [Thermoplasmata archaeon]
MDVEVRYPGLARSVVILGRPNRYLARVRRTTGGPAFYAHVPNPGRMEELLLFGETRGYIVPVPGDHRKTRFDLVSVRHDGTLVSVDSRVANRLVARALTAGLLPEFGGGSWKAEVGYESCRLDFGVRRDQRVVALLEVKSSNLRVQRTAFFPDAPTARGTRHLLTLARAARAGVQAGVLFMVQHDRADEFIPNSALDPDFSRALGAAARSGVVLAAQTMKITPGGVRWGRSIPVKLN